MNDKWRSLFGLSSWSSFLWPQSPKEWKRQIIGVLILLPFAMVVFLLLHTSQS